MDHRTCCLLVGVCWTAGFLHSIGQILVTFRLPFCGPNIMDHFTCDIFPLIQHACTDTFLAGLLVAVNGGVIPVITFVMLLVSYVFILCSMRTHSSAGRRTSLSPCSSHITVLVFFFVPCIFMYLRPVATFPMDKAIAVFYTLITPMLNPVIYTARNTEVKNAIRMLLNRNTTSENKWLDMNILFLSWLLQKALLIPLTWHLYTCARYYYNYSHFTDGEQWISRKLNKPTNIRDRTSIQTSILVNSNLIVFQLFQKISKKRQNFIRTKSLDF